MDAAAISKKYLEHVQMKNAMLASSGTTVTHSATANNYTANAYNASTPVQANNASAANVVPYGATAPVAATPYVRSAPGAQPSGLTSAPSTASGTAGYPIGAAPNSLASAPANGGFSIPARSPSYPSLDATVQSAGAGGGGTTYPRAAQTAAAYPSGQAPLGMIGQSGYATAPSGDFVGEAPRPVTGTIGFATSTVGGMPTGARPTAPTAQGASTTGAASPYSTAPQYR
jgi:hypothetical protein